MGSVQAQKNDKSYMPFIQSATWSVNNSKYRTAGDTIFNGLSYIKVYKHTENTPFDYTEGRADYFCSIRNDTAEKRVYIVIPDGINIYNKTGCCEGMTNNNTEFLLYDFSLNVGDTAVCYKWESGGLVQVLATRADSIFIDAGNANIFNYQNNDSIVRVNDRVHKRILINEFSCFNTRFKVWIEGIGSSSGFLSGPEHLSTCGLNPQYLLCYSDSNDNVYFTGLDCLDDNDSDCFSMGSDAKVIEFDEMKESVVILVNSEANTINLSFPNNDVYNVSIYNIYAQCVYNATINSDILHINTCGYAKGLYIVKIRRNNKIFITKKVII